MNEETKEKSICEANFVWIFALYLEGTEQIRNIYGGKKNVSSII